MSYTYLIASVNKLIVKIHQDISKQSKKKHIPKFLSNFVKKKTKTKTKVFINAAKFFLFD